MDEARRKQLVEQYKDGYRVVADALTGATEDEMDRHPAPGKWSAREIVHHLADSEMTSAIRLRRLIAEHHPAIHGYDQEEFARRLHYDRPWQPSLEAFRYARETTGQLLDCLTPAEWGREGTHSDTGQYSVETWLEIYARHAHNHADQIRVARTGPR